MGGETSANNVHTCLRFGLVNQNKYRGADGNAPPSGGQYFSTICLTMVHAHHELRLLAAARARRTARERVVYVEDSNDACLSHTVGAQALMQKPQRKRRCAASFF